MARTEIVAEPGVPQVIVSRAFATTAEVLVGPTPSPTCSPGGWGRPS